MQQRAAVLALQVKMLRAFLVNAGANLLAADVLILMAGTGNALHDVLAHPAVANQPVQMPVHRGKPYRGPDALEMPRNLAHCDLTAAERRYISQNRLALLRIVPSRPLHDSIPE